MGASYPALTADAAAAPEQASCGITDFAAATLAAVNQRRAVGSTCGARGSFDPSVPLRWSSHLALASAAHSADMAQQDYFSHTSADGRSMRGRVNETGYRWDSRGENIAAGYSGVDSVFECWMRSEGHCVNRMNPAFDEMGLACVIGVARTRYGRQWTQSLARKR